MIFFGSAKIVGAAGSQKSASDHAINELRKSKARFPRSAIDGQILQDDML